MDNDQRKHLTELRQTYQRRLQILELRAAQEGLQTPPHVLIETEDLHKKIIEIDNQLSIYSESRPTPKNKIRNLFTTYHDILTKLSTRFDLNQCFVRDMELDHLARNCLAGNHVMLVGDIGSGKTSILKRLLVYPEIQSYKVKYIDISENHNRFSSGLWRTVITSLKESDPGEMNNYEIFHELENIPNNYKYILCIDDIDKFIDTPAFNPEDLRRLSMLTVTRKNLSIVLTSPAYPRYLWQTQEITNRWYNRFSLFHVTSVPPQQAQKLLNSVGIIEPKYIEFCFSIVKKMLPLDLLLVVYYLQKNKSYNTRDYETVEKQYLEDIKLVRPEERRE